MAMHATQTELPGVLILEPKVFGDERGVFFETYNAREFAELTGTSAVFVQDNHSCSKKNVLRGLHYQIRRPQGKLVRVVEGEMFDVAVDVRRSSPTCGRWAGVRLSAENRRHLWIPPGYAHGFLALSESAAVLYKVTDYWAPAFERCIIWNDPQLAIGWPLQGAPVLSARDAQGARFSSAELFD
jgi:dTDP-4-dehydrorhamnose 3,5-epimerase